MLHIVHLLTLDIFLSENKKTHPEECFEKSDDSLPTGRKHLVFTEWTDFPGIPGKTVQHHADTVFGEKISDIFKQNIQMLFVLHIHL